MNENISKRVVSGMRTTGNMHIGHYHGVLKNWLVLQKKYKCFFFAADLHAMTTYTLYSKLLRENTKQMIKEWLSVGIDPNKSCIFVQSLLPEHAEMHLILSMISPINWLQRIPAYKDNAKLSQRNYGFLGYPVLQSADILLYNPDYIPIGEDQISHLEITRKISRKFNLTFGEKTNITTLIENHVSLLSKTELGNFINLIKIYKKKKLFILFKTIKKHYFEISHQKRK